MTRRVVGRVLAVAAFVASAAFADAPVAEFPARFDDHETIVVVAVLRGPGVVRRVRQRAEADSVLVIDDASRLHLEPTDGTEPVEATWRWASHRVAAVRLTEASLDRLRQDLEDAFGEPVRVRGGTGRLVFSRSHASYTGRLTVRAALHTGRFHVGVTETIRCRGTRAAPELGADDR